MKKIIKTIWKYHRRRMLGILFIVFVIVVFVALEQSVKDKSDSLEQAAVTNTTNIEEQKPMEPAEKPEKIDTSEFESRIPKNREMTPKEIVSIINEFRDSDKPIDIQAVYQNLGIESSILTAVFLEADIWETNIGGNKHDEEIIILSDGWRSWQYLIFTKNKNANSYRFLDHLDFVTKSAPPQHSIVSIGNGGPWLVIKYLDESSFGIGVWHAWESWYLVDGNKINESLKRLDYAESSYWPYPFHVAYESSRSLEKEFNDTYLIDYLMDISYTQNISGLKEGEDLFSKKEKVRYYWNNYRKEFLLDKSISKETERQIIFEKDKDEFLKYNFKELVSLAKNGSDAQKEWIKLFLEKCEDSWEKGNLLDLLTISVEDLLDTFPLLKGSYWIYDASVKWTVDSNGDTERNFTWKIEVVDTAVYKNIIAVHLRGFPWQLDWHHEGCLESDDDTMIIVDLNKFYLINDIGAFEEIESKEDLSDDLNDDNLWFDFPLTPGKTYAYMDEYTKQREDHYYQWYVKSKSPADLKGVKGVLPSVTATEYEVEFYTLPGHRTINFIPGIGITGYTYVHHGTISEAYLELVEYYLPKEYRGL